MKKREYQPVKIYYLPEERAKLEKVASAQGYACLGRYLRQRFEEESEFDAKRLNWINARIDELLTLSSLDELQHLLKKRKIAEGGEHGGRN